MFLIKQKVKGPLGEQEPKREKKSRPVKVARVRERAISLEAFQKKRHRKPNRAEERENEQEEKPKWNESKGEGRGDLGPENLKDFHRQKSHVIPSSAY